MQKSKMKTISTLDLKKQYRSISGGIKEAVIKVLESGNFILGESVRKLEEEIANYCHVKYAIGVASGTDALELSLVALGINKGDEVITSPFTFISTAESVVKIGARPVFADISPKTYNINPDDIKRGVTKRTKAIIPIHLYGQPSDMNPILNLADKYGLFIIEDAAQAFGAEYNNKKVGSFGNTGIFSFFPTKNLGSYGDGGMVVTDSKRLYEKIRMLRVHGSKERYYHLINGYNSRLDELQAAILRVKLAFIDRWVNARRRRAYYYNKTLRGLKDKIITPYEDEGNRHVYNIYTIRTPLRDSLHKFLKKRGISTAIYYPIPLHLQKVYRDLGYKKGDFPEAEKSSREVLSLPIYPELTKYQQRVIVKNILEFTEKYSK